MAERPILFSGAMVRALLAGSKMQTRRVVALPRSRSSFVMEDHGAGWWPYQSDDGESSLCDDGMEHPYACPYGNPGDRLWVREAFRFPTSLDRLSPSAVAEKALDAGYRKALAPTHYEADGARTGEWHGFDTPPAKTVPGKLRPGMFMPRWASRILLEVTDVRVERLQDISTADAIAEGVDEWRRGACSAENPFGYGPADYFRLLWSQINGDGSWYADPWVWAVSFKRIQEAAHG